MKPGDLIEWVYEVDNEVVTEGEKLWSTVEDRWITIDGKALLISCVDDILTYFSLHGLFQVHVDDTRSPWTQRRSHHEQTWMTHAPVLDRDPSTRPIIPRVVN